jgi:hypothetical protein
LKSRFIIAALLIAAAAATTFLVGKPRATPRTRGPLNHEAYVWQRIWNGPVQQAITAHGTHFSRLVLLAAEVDWVRREPRLVRVEPDSAALLNSAREIGLALRIGPYGGPFGRDDRWTRWLCDLTSSLVTEAQTNGLPVAELQIDFDCAESKLDGYRVWVEAIRQRVAPLPVTITVLPAWLDRRAFKALVAATDGYVLQVHSLERPKSAHEPLVLCDPALGRRWVEQAARLNVPFRVALPTYGYRVAFDGGARFVGISAEGPAPNWPEGVRVQELHADPVAMEALVRAWAEDRPTVLQGVIWYRLPVAGDSLNWSWSTLSEVIAGRTPRAALTVKALHPKPALVEIELSNTGTADATSTNAVIARWRNALLVACDGLPGFEAVERSGEMVEFRDRAGPRLAPGERRIIGWLRLNQESEVQVELSTP